MCFGPLDFQWKLFKHSTVSDDVNPRPIPDEVFNEMLFTKTTSLNMAMRPRKLEKDSRYTISFRASRRGGPYGEIRYGWLTNSPPENGTAVGGYRRYKGVLLRNIVEVPKYGPPLLSELAVLRGRNFRLVATFE